MPLVVRSRVTTTLVDRAGAMDRAFRAMERGGVPQQIGAVLMLDGPLTPPQVRELVGDRIRAVPRLRQRLVAAPFGCGGPFWVDDATFDLDRHVRRVECRPPGDEQALLSTAVDVLRAPLPRDAPQWAVVLVEGWEERSALVVVLHHALADGVGGLGVLGSLVDPGSPPAEEGFPRPRPTVPALLVDSVTAKARALTHVAGSWRLLRASMSAGGGVRPPRAEECSLLQVTGPRRQVAVVRASYSSVRTAAHRHGATANDALLVAIAAALRRVVEGRGDRLGTLAVTVPVSRRSVAGPGLGNAVSPLLVPVPTTGPPAERLAAVAGQVRARRADATAPAPIAVLGGLFRPLAALGGYRWYLDHQRRFHTLVSHLRGPAEPVRFGGRRVNGIVPLGVAGGGNATVYFEVLSYAGTLTVAAVVDPDRFPDVDVLTEALAGELRALEG